MTADFVVRILEGFEGTLDEVLERLKQGHLRQEIEALQQHIALQTRAARTARCAGPAGIVVASLNSGTHF